MMANSSQHAAQAAVWILIPVHNRCHMTRACLANLRKNGLFDSMVVCVVDDASTDGTSLMLRDEFPEVHVLAGDGNLYWGGGIAHGMREAAREGAEIHLWLNDDCLPAPSSIETVVDRVRVTRGICGGTCYDPEQPDRITYGGARIGKPGPELVPEATFVEMDVLNGNLVAVHRDVVSAIGLLDSRAFPHYGGDIDYCIRAKRAGFRVEVAGSARALNRRDYPFSVFGVSKPAAAVFREPFRIGSSLYWRAYWGILRRSYGFWAFFRWPAYWLRLVRIWWQAYHRQKTAS